MEEKRPLNWNRYGDVVVIDLPTDLLDALDIVLAKDAWLEFVDREKPKRVVFNFDRVARCGSESIGNLIRVANRVRADGGDVRLCSMHHRIREIFEICRLIPGVFTLFPSTTEAVESFAK